MKSLLESGVTPVFCAITHDSQGSLLNSNADSVASAVAVASARIGATDLVFCFEKNGVLTNIDDDNSVVAEITRAKYAELRQSEVVNKGMIPKIDNAFRAIDKGVKSVIIKHSDNLLKTLGTVIK